MTGKKKPTPQQKRQQVVDASGWTHIVKGRPSNSRTQHSILASHQRSSSLDTSFTLETYLSKFRNHYFPRWRESSCFKGLERIFEENISVLRGGITITDCVCLGLGSMTSGLETPSFELAALMDMLEILGSFPPIKHASCT